MKDEKSLVGEIVSTPTVSPALRSLDAEPWFAQLSDDEKLTIKREDAQLAAIYQFAGRSRLAAAASLAKIYEVLGPRKGRFEKYIKRYHLKRRSAYRAIKSYHNVEHLPQAILAVAMARNMPLMGETEAAPYGIYTEAIKKLPPPTTKSITDDKAGEYLNMLEAKRREIKPKPKGREVQEVIGPTDPKDLMRECYRFVDIRFKRLPREMTSRKKAEWLRTCCGMLLKLAGLSGEPVVPVVSPPSDFVAIRGRPRIH